MGFVSGESLSSAALARVAELVEQFSVGVTAAVDAVLATEFVDDVEMLVLVALFRMGPLTTAQLALRAGCSRGATNRFVKHLEARGIVERTASPVDGRAVLVVPTAVGVRTLAEMERATFRFLDGARPLAAEIAEVLERDLGVAPVGGAAAGRTGVDALAILEGIALTGIELSEAARRRAGELHVRGRQRNVLVALAVRGPSRPSEIADEQALSSARTTYLLDQLEAKGLVERRHAAHDRRCVSVSITARGRAAVAAVLAGIEDAAVDLQSLFATIRDLRTRARAVAGSRAELLTPL